MSDFIENLMQELNELDSKHKELETELDKIEKEQVQKLKDLIEFYKPVMMWYKERYYFKHPVLPYRSRRGPILGYDNEEDNLIVYDINRDAVLYESLSYQDEFKTYPIWKVVKDGHFSNAMHGIKHLEVMLSDYIERINKKLEDKKYEIKHS